MNREEAKAAIKGWEDSIMSATVNVMELQSHVTHQILAKATNLTGVTATKVKTAFDEAGFIWEGFDLIQKQLDRAQQLYDTIKDSWFPSGQTLRDIEALLTGETVELTAVLVPLDQRSLVSSKAKVVTTSLEKLLQRCVEGFAAKRDVVMEVDKALNELPGLVDDLESKLPEIKLLADFLGAPATTEMRKMEEAVKGYRNAIFTDPLGTIAAAKQTADALVEMKRRYGTTVERRQRGETSAPVPPVRQQEKKPAEKPVTRPTTPPDPVVPTPVQPQLPAEPPVDPKLGNLINNAGGTTDAPVTDTPADAAVTDLISQPGRKVEKDSSTTRPDPSVERTVTRPATGGKPGSDIEAVLSGDGDLPARGKGKTAPATDGKPDPAVEKAVSGGTRTGGTTGSDTTTTARPDPALDKALNSGPPARKGDDLADLLGETPSKRKPAPADTGKKPGTAEKEKKGDETSTAVEGLITGGGGKPAAEKDRKTGDTSAAVEGLITGGGKTDKPAKTEEQGKPAANPPKPQSGTKKLEDLF